MKIQEQDIYHGAALMQIVEHPSFKALNKGSNRYGHYLVNANCHLFIRYSTSDAESWVFTYSPEQLEPIRNILESTATVFLCLVCGNQSICLINEEQIQEIIDIESEESQWIKVTAPPRKSFRVSGSFGKIKGTIAHSSFPNVIFD